MSDKITFEESLEEDDWGIIIGKNGELKGMFIPEGEKETDVPPDVLPSLVAQGQSAQVVKSFLKL